MNIDIGYQRPILVRLWDRYYNPIGMQFVNWHGKRPGVSQFTEYGSGSGDR